MKQIMNVRIVVLLCFLTSAVFNSCNLERIEDSSPNLCPNPPKSIFLVSTDMCETTCQVSLTNNSTNATSYAWDFGDGSNATLTTPPVKSYATAGTYTIRLIAISAGGCRDTSTHEIVVTQAVNVSASFTVINDGCSAPCTVQFNNTSQNATSYNWDFGDLGTSSTASPSHTFLTKGNYTVRLIATGPSGKDTAETTVAIIKLPTAGFTFSNDNCVGPCSVQFTETSQDETAYSWDFGDGTATVTTANPSHTFQTKGTYSVRLIALNVDGADTITQTVTIKSPNFKTVVDVNNADVSPLFGVVKSNGDFHVLFQQNGYKSVLISPTGTVGNLATYSLPDLEEFHGAIASGDGGMGLTGILYSPLSAVAVKISASQTLSFSKKFSFTGTSQLSYGQGIGLNNAGQFVVTGSYIPTGGGDMFPGFALVSQNGTLSTNTYVNTPVATTSAVYGTGITQLSNNDYMVVAPQWTFGGNPTTYLVRTGSTGLHIQNTNLGTSVNVEQIVSVTTTSFLVRSSSGSYSISRHSGTGAVQSTTSLGSIKSVVLFIANDGNLIMCGALNGDIIMRKYNSSSMAVIWEKTYAEAGGTAIPKSVVHTLDNGYLICAAFTSATNQKRLLLIRTDATGNAD
ncbi:MAG: PKD domain-containing protein [Lewinellaceae bacterium]|nr:PKD domain-containing protein [Lewinellaceae bacterium]